MAARLDCASDDTNGCACGEQRYREDDAMTPEEYEHQINRDRQRRYTRAMIHHGDCRDPDHLGCPLCEPEEDDDD